MPGTNPGIGSLPPLGGNPTVLHRLQLLPVVWNLGGSCPFRTDLDWPGLDQICFLQLGLVVLLLVMSPGSEHNLHLLHQLATSLRHFTVLRNQLILHLHRSHSYREIAAAAQLDHSSVRDIVRRTKPRPELLASIESGEINWEFTTPKEVTNYLLERYADIPPVSNQELQSLCNDIDALNLPDPQAPPNWKWLIVDLKGKFQHALISRDTLDADKIAALYRLGKLAEQYRLQTYGVDALADLRSRFMPAIGSLAVEASQRSRRDPP